MPSGVPLPPEERDAARKASNKRYREKNKDKRAANHKKWWDKNRNDPALKRAASERSRKWYRENKERARKNSDEARYKKQYGLGLEEVKELHKRNPNCQICKVSLQTIKAHIDHCHTTGVIRGVLCSNCNRGLGHFKDSPEFLAEAISYLEKQMDHQSEGSRP